MKTEQTKSIKLVIAREKKKKGNFLKQKDGLGLDFFFFFLNFGEIEKRI